MGKSIVTCLSKLSVAILCVVGLIELGLALWTLLDHQYKSLAYNLADVGYIDLWVLRYLSMCLFASSIITLVMSVILIWGLYSANAFIFISSTMIALFVIVECAVAVLTLTNKFQMRLTLQEQLPKLVITYRQGNDERASRALDILQSTFRCCGSDGRLSYQNNVPPSCNMYSVGCLTRTMYFLDTSMDALASILLFFSIVKLFLVMFFYSFICLHQRSARKTSEGNPHLLHHSPDWRHSSSFDSSSSSDNLPKKILISPPMATHEHEFIEKRRVIQNEYDSQMPKKGVQSAAPMLPPPPPPPLPSTSSSSSDQNLEITCHEQHVARKLSSISEKTERTETDDSEPDLLRVKLHNQTRKAIATSVQQKQTPGPPLPKKLPIIKNRRKTVGDDENDDDSGVERSSSEKSFDDQQINKRRSDTPTSVESASKAKPSHKKSTGKLPPTLSFSNVFVTSVSQTDIKQASHDAEAKKSLTASSSASSSLSDHLLSSGATTPKPILKKHLHQSSPPSDQDRVPPSYLDQKKISSLIQSKAYVKLDASLANHHLPAKSYLLLKSKGISVPRPAPRPSLKQPLKRLQDESLV